MASQSPNSGDLTIQLTDGPASAATAAGGGGGTEHLSLIGPSQLSADAPTLGSGTSLDKHAPLPRRVRCHLVLLWALGTSALVLSIVALAMLPATSETGAGSDGSGAGSGMSGSGSSTVAAGLANILMTVPLGARSVSRVAFGSCTAYDTRPQPIWTEVGAMCGGDRKSVV